MLAVCVNGPLIRPSGTFVTFLYPLLGLYCLLRWWMEDRCTFGTPSPWESLGLHPPFH